MSLGLEIADKPASFNAAESRMKVGIVGSGVVGQTIGAKLVERGEDVVLGTRSPADIDRKRGMARRLRILRSSAERAELP